MAKITYVEFNGTEHVVDVADGLTVMEGAREQRDSRYRSRLRGCLCLPRPAMSMSTLVGPTKLPAKDAMEEDMLDFAYQPDPQKVAPDLPT